MNNLSLATRTGSIIVIWQERTRVSRVLSVLLKFSHLVNGSWDLNLHPCLAMAELDLDTLLAPPHPASLTPICADHPASRKKRVIPFPSFNQFRDVPIFLHPGRITKF